MTGYARSWRGICALLSINCYRPPSLQNDPGAVSALLVVREGHIPDPPGYLLGKRPTRLHLSALVHYGPLPLGFLRERGHRIRPYDTSAGDD